MTTLDDWAEDHRRRRKEELERSAGWKIQAEMLAEMDREIFRGLKALASSGSISRRVVTVVSGLSSAGRTHERPRRVGGGPRAPPQPGA